MFYLFLHLSVGGKHGDIKSREVKVEQLQTGKATQMQDAHTINSCQLFILLRGMMCVENTPVKGQDHQYQSQTQMVNGGFPSMSRDPWRENKIGMDIFLINL